ncbi:hypothetical protein VF13_38485 [Nostoc linckia z16]|nr:hypothetical protein VF13_38485 [Nostoc linckia z16]
MRHTVLVLLLSFFSLYAQAQVLQESNEKVRVDPFQYRTTIIRPAPELNGNYQELLNSQYYNYNSRSIPVSQTENVYNYYRRVDSANRAYKNYLNSFKSLKDYVRDLYRRSGNDPSLKPIADSVAAIIKKDSVTALEQLKQKKRFDSLSILRDNEKAVALLLSVYAQKDSIFRKITNNNIQALKEVNTSILIDTLIANRSEDASIAKFLYKNNIGIFQNTNDLIASVNKIQALIVSFEQKLDSLKGLTNNFSQIILFAPFEVDLLKRSQKIETEINNFTVKYNNFKNTYDDFLKQKKDLANKEDSNDLAVIPSLVSQLGQGAVTPNITLLGNTNFGSTESGLYGDIRIFTAPVSVNQQASIRNFFIPEASSFGFLTNFGFSFIPIEKGRRDNRIGVFGALNYLGKNIPDSLNSKSISTNTFHGRLGIQAIIIPGVVSAYLAANYLLVTDNSNDFAVNYPNQSGRGRLFSEFGFKFFISPTKRSQLKLLFDLGFVRINDDMRTMFSNTDFKETNDSIIPILKIGLKKNFGF